MDVEFAAMMKKKPILKSEEELQDLNKMKLCKIKKDNWSVVYQRTTDQTVQKQMFFLVDKNLYSTTALTYIMGFTEACKTNAIIDQKCFSDMIKWYIAVRSTLLNMMSKSLKVQKMQQ